MLLNIQGPSPTGVPGRAVRALVLPRGQYFWIIIQTVGPGSIRIGTQQSEVEQAQGGAYDGVEIPASVWPPFEAWWKDELWIIAENANAQVRVIVTGLTGGNQT
jgi:hypothetical protein